MRIFFMTPLAKVNFYTGLVFVIAVPISVTVMHISTAVREGYNPADFLALCMAWGFSAGIWIFLRKTPTQIICDDKAQTLTLKSRSGETTIGIWNITSIKRVMHSSKPRWFNEHEQVYIRTVDRSFLLHFAYRNMDECINIITRVKPSITVE